MREAVAATRERLMIDLLQMARSGHVTKVFDGSVLSQDKVDVLLELLRSVPSSFNVQPCHYLVARSPAARARIAKSLKGGFEGNQVKIDTASHVIVFCTRMALSPEHVDAVFAQEQADRKFPDDEQEQRWRGIVRKGLDMHVYDKRDLSAWLEKQTYLALGIMMMAAAVADIDITPMEGFFTKTLDEEFGLPARGYTSTVLLSIGRRDPNDWILSVPKSRLPSVQLFTFLD
jgi:nitroreductase / dihydropteridine reductase